jgi:hypothetical protein
MDGFKVFTLGEEFSVIKMQEFIRKLHSNNQQYIVMVDPGLSHATKSNGVD